MYALPKNMSSQQDDISMVSVEPSLSNLEPIPPQPPPPKPATDPVIAQDAAAAGSAKGSGPGSDSNDIFTLAPIDALKMLCDLIETLVRITGDVPPTPPIAQPGAPGLRFMQAERENPGRKAGARSRPEVQRSESSEDVDGVPPRAKTPIGSPESGPTEPLHIIGANMEPLNIQHGAIIRKFYSKKPPPISLEEYLMRLHHYCPMSTAVYLTTSLYIHRLAVVERIIPVTARNVHRLVLAGLRVAMKALEDLSYPHRRVAKVGGVSEPELGRLEVSFCFVTNFELKVDQEMLQQHIETMKDDVKVLGPPLDFQPRMPSTRKRPENGLNRIMAQTSISTKAPMTA